MDRNLLFRKIGSIPTLFCLEDDFEEELDVDCIYGETGRDDMLDNDEIDSEEFGFMSGWDAAWEDA